jgi:uncharacterized RDD family membrane protein YckC
MKCPKCGYLGFEHVERCRNCGYEFSLAASAALRVPDLPLRGDPQAMNPLDDLSMVDAAMVPPPSVRLSDAAPDLDRIFGAPEQPTPTPQSPDARRAELPLFGPPIPDDEPLITKASPPRQPLAVRRATPDAPRVRAEPPLRAPTLDLAIDLDEAPATSIAALAPSSRAGRSPWSARGGQAVDVAAAEPVARDAAVASRLLAVILDLVILAAIDVAVVYFTMQICGIGVEDVAIVPKGPLLAFLLVQNGGYLVAFTAGGQTLGKMAAGIRVVPAVSDAPLDLGQAFLRTLMWGVLAVPAGLGFLTAVFSRDHRGLHDRFAGTRVVRASA